MAVDKLFGAERQYKVLFQEAVNIMSVFRDLMFLQCVSMLEV